jgi:hypothetical protein
MSEYNKRPAVRERLLSRLRHDIVFKLAWNIRTLLRAALKKRNHKKNTRLHIILGCTVIEFKMHMQRQFHVGMSWLNHGEWEIDHIVPLSAARSSLEIISLFHHTNLRPFWKSENRSKGARDMFLI